MAEENNPSPEVKPEVKDTKPKDTKEKSVEELEKALEIANVRLKEQEVMIGKQSTEVGETRAEIAKLKEQLKPKPEEETAGEDEEILEVAKDLEKDGMSKEDAIYNAKILVGFDKKRMGKRVMNETIDLVDEALDDGRIDKKLFEENQAEIMAEFKERKLAPTARGNFKIFKKCFDDVVKRKADQLREEEKKKSEEKRDGLIDETSQPDKGKREEIFKKEDDKQREEIRKAGPKRESTFF